jgi:hypothetical protein
VYRQDECSRNECIASGDEGGVNGAGHGQGIKFRVATRSGKNFQS